MSCKIYPEMRLPFLARISESHYFYVLQENKGRKILENQAADLLPPNQAKHSREDA